MAIHYGIEIIKKIPSKRYIYHDEFKKQSENWKIKREFDGNEAVQFSK